MSIQQIQASEVTTTYCVLFRTDEPHPSRMSGVLAGMDNGSIFTDDPVNPTWGVVQEFFDGCIYLDGILDPTTIATIIADLRQERMVLAPLWLNDPRRDWLPQDVDERELLHRFL